MFPIRKPGHGVESIRPTIDENLLPLTATQRHAVLHFIKQQMVGPVTPVQPLPKRCANCQQGRANTPPSEIRKAYTAFVMHLRLKFKNPINLQGTTEERLHMVVTPFPNTVLFESVLVSVVSRLLT